MTGDPLLPTADTRSVSSTFASDRAPVLSVRQGELFAVQTRSILTHVPADERSHFSRLADYSHMDIPVTGPIVIEGVHAGDILRIDILDVQIAEMAAMITIAGRGGFSRTLRPAGRLLPIVDGQVMFGDIGLPTQPMIGKIGVGTPAAPHCSTVGSHGGNMDCAEIGPGSTLFLPVAVDGAHVYIGDLHGLQADGEASLTGAEVEGTVIASCHVVPNVTLRHPLLVSGGQLITIGDGHDLDEAVQVALDDMLELVKDTLHLTDEDAAMLLSIAGEVGVCQVVNARRSAKVSIPLTVCPAEPFIHRI